MATTRDYDFDVTSNRTKLVEKQGSATTTWSNTFDSASRQLSTTATGSGAGSGTYSYDVFGRTTILPGIDAVPATPTTLSYYADGSTYRQDQGANAQTFTRDPLGRVSTTNIATNGGASQNTITSHYAGTSDSPTWTQDQLAGTWTRNVTGPGGALAILETGTGTTTAKADLQLANPHGDVVATIDVTANVGSAAMSSVADYDEYGIIVTATAPSPYGWVGTAMRSSANQGGLIQMGARMYNPATGRFLTTDPVPGGTPNPYTYPPDPVNMYDLAGSWSIGGIISGIVNTVRRAVQWVANTATAAFSSVVRTVTFGRININIPKIKIPKFNIRSITRSSSSTSSSHLGGTTAMINPKNWLTGPVRLPDQAQGSGTWCAGPCFQVTASGSGHGALSVGGLGWGASLTAGAGSSTTYEDGAMSTQGGFRWLGGPSISRGDDGSWSGGVGPGDAVYFGRFRNFLVW